MHLKLATPLISETSRGVLQGYRVHLLNRRISSKQPSDFACGTQLRIPFTSALEKIALSERLPAGGPRSLNLRDRDGDFFAPGDGSCASQRQRFPIERLRGVGTTGVVRCRRFEIQAAADLLTSEFSGHDGKHLIGTRKTWRQRERVVRHAYTRALVRA